MGTILCNLNIVLNIVNLAVALGVIYYFATMRDLTKETTRPQVDAVSVMKDASELPSNRIRAAYLLESDVKKGYEMEVMGESQMDLAKFDGDHSILSTNLASEVLDRKMALRELEREVAEDINVNLPEE
tara:strand:+ start:759 stop:1145 length:387 start_codon:yes stop_codon:yes gene_type:complete